MSLVARAALQDPGLRQALEPHETPLSYATVAQALAGAVRDEPYGIAPPAPERDTLVDVLMGSWMPRWARGDRIDRVLGRVSRWGPPTSSAATLYRSLDGQATAGLVVTEHRLVIVVADSGLTPYDDPTRPGRTRLGTRYRVLWGAPRTALAAARRRGSLVQRGRLELIFFDQSMCALTTGVLMAGGAKRTLVALGVPATPPPLP